MQTSRDYNRVQITRALLTKIFSHIAVQDTGYKTPCWLWQQSKPQQYSLIWTDGAQYYAHRLMYCLFVGKVAPELHCDHLCRVPACVNPAHLEPVTPQVNVHRGLGASAHNVQKTHCPQGHPFTEDNILYYGQHKRWRKCKICNRAFYRANGRKYRNTYRAKHYS